MRHGYDGEFAMLDVTHGSLVYARHRPRRIGFRWHGVRRAMAACAYMIARWRDRARQRRFLAAMDDRLLSDIGVTRIEAEREYEKPFWR
jgi:uncharacterized protein YjiS (DUF1127 family)